MVLKHQVSFTINFVTTGGTLAKDPVKLNYYVSGLDIDGDGAFHKRVYRG
jgi:hypothetical protein